MSEPRPSPCPGCGARLWMTIDGKIICRVCRYEYYTEEHPAMSILFDCLAREKKGKSFHANRMAADLEEAIRLMRKPYQFKAVITAKTHKHIDGVSEQNDREHIAPVTREESK